jgi:ubiquinone/menaquinone biosynthesis C-methylase UbiE
MLEKNIRNFFDEYAKLRDVVFSKDPILNYEQKMRQRTIMSLIPNEKFGITLDAGCGNGRDLAIHLKASQKVIGLDISRKMLDEAKKKIK